MRKLPIIAISSFKFLFCRYSLAFRVRTRAAVACARVTVRFGSKFEPVPRIILRPQARAT
mgnify:CR=1 FL=1